MSIPVSEREAAASIAADKIQEIMHSTCDAKREGGCLTHGILKAMIRLEIDKMIIPAAPTTGAVNNVR